MEQQVLIKKREEECTKKEKSVVDCTTDYKSIQEGDRKKTENIDGQKKSSPECKKIVGKIQFNPAIHSIKSQNNQRSKKCFRKREKQKKEKRKKTEKESDYLQDYNDILLDNLLKEYYTTKSPHLIISRQWFFKIKKNTIMLKNARECTDENGKKVYYEIDQIGSNVRYVQKKDVFVLNPSTMSRNIIFIIVRLADLSHIEK